MEPTSANKSARKKYILQRPKISDDMRKISKGEALPHIVSLLLE